MSRRLAGRGAGGAARRRGAAALGLGLAAAALVTGIALGGLPAQAADPSQAAALAAVAPMAAPSGTAATTVTTGGTSLTLTATPAAGLPPSGAQITVTGKGFDPSHDLWVAVCQDDGVAPQALINCVGGAIPDQNETTGWGIVTDAKQPPYPGPVTTRWRKDGAFELTLQLPSAISESADCVSAPCSVFTRSSVDSDRSQDAAVRIAFTPPPGESSPPTSSGAPSTTESTGSSSPTSSAEPTTQTFGEVPTTVTPNSMLRTTVVAGEPQTVVFSGFRPGEKVDVTLFSDPVALPAVTAQPDGHVRISFTVPKDLPAGEHILQAIGTTSGRVGIARFSVTAVSTSTSASATGSTSAVSAASTASAVSAGSAVSTALASSVPATSSAAISVAGSTAAQTAGSVTATAASSSAAGGAAGGGNRLLWLWIVLAVLVIVGGAAGIVAMVRNRRGDDDGDVTGAAAPPPEPGWSAGPDAGPTMVLGPPGHTAPQVDPGGGFGLLSGREHPDGPALYSGGGWPDQPTQAMGDQPTQAMGGQPTQAIGGRQPGPTGPDQGSATGQWRPGATGQAPAGPSDQGPSDQGPSTQQWRPDFGGESGATAPSGGDAEDSGPGTQQWRPDFTGEQPPADGDEPPRGRHRTQ